MGLTGVSLDLCGVLDEIPGEFAVEPATGIHLYINGQGVANILIIPEMKGNPMTDTVLVPKHQSINFG